MPLYGEKKSAQIGRSAPRVDGCEKVTGRAVYAGDLTLPGMLLGGMLRCKHAPAKITRISAAKARAIPGVHAVVTFEDMPVLKSWAGYMYLTGEVKYPGDVIAIAAAESRALLEEALAAIEYEYEEVPGVFSIEEALAENAPLVHPQYPGNVFKDAHFTLRKGDADRAFADCDTVIEREYRTPFIEHAYIEPEAVVACENRGEGVMTVYASAQNPYFTRRYVADALGVSIHNARVIQQTLGGSFGGKEEGVGLLAGRASYLARLTGRPVKMVFSREESFLESAKGHPFRFRYKIGATKEGKILALKGELVDESGAYSNQTQFMNWRASVHSAGPYEIDHISTDVFGVFTNNIHSGAFRGYSSQMLIFAGEQLIEELADELGIDPLTLRKKNCLKTGSRTATGQQVREVILEELIEYTAAQTDYSAKRAANLRQAATVRRRGIGMSISYRGCGLGAESPDAAGSMITACEDGSVILNVGISENGQGLKTVYAQIAAEAMGLPLSSFRVSGIDTQTHPDSGMSVASRGTVVGAQSLRRAGEKLRELMIGHAAALVWKCSPKEVKLEDGYFYRKDGSGEKCPFGEVCASCLWSGRQMSVYDWYTPDPFIQDHHTGQGDAFPTYSYGCVVAEVEVDMQTGYVDVKRVTASHDVGRAINPALIKGQVYGGIAMGQGFGVMEEVEVSRGRVGQLNLDTYIIPTAMDIPEMAVNIFECEDGAGTYGAKSVGEPATEAVTAAIANAIANATGRRIRTAPASLENVLLGKKLSR